MVVYLGAVASDTEGHHDPVHVVEAEATESARWAGLKVRSRKVWTPRRALSLVDGGAIMSS